MKRNIVTVLFLLGVSCFLYDFVWLIPEIDMLLDQSSALIPLGLYEEAKQYQTEAMALSAWVVPIAVVGFLLIMPLNYFIIIKSLKNYASKK